MLEICQEQQQATNQAVSNYCLTGTTDAFRLSWTPTSYAEQQLSAVITDSCMQLNITTRHLCEPRQTDPLAHTTLNDNKAKIKLTHWREIAELNNSDMCDISILPLKRSLKEPSSDTELCHLVQLGIMLHSARHAVNW